MKKTNAMRVLDAQHIPYTVTEYDPTGEFHSAEQAAGLIGAAVETVYKTLVVLREPARAKPLLVMVAADRELDLRRLARSVGEKKLRMASLREAEQITGLQVGGISALSLMNRGYEICIDRAALDLDQVHISAGARGVDVKLRVPALIQLTHARVVDAAEAPAA